MAAYKIIITLCMLQCLQIEAILNKGKHYHRFPTPKQKRLTENSEVADHSKGTGLQEPDDVSQNFVQDLEKADDSYTISRNINKASAKGLTVLEVNFIKNNYYLKNLPFKKADEKSNTVSKNLDKTLRDENGGKATIVPRASEDMLKVVNIGNKFNNTEHVIDKIVFPDTNITAFLNSHGHQGNDLNKNGEQTDLRTKSIDEETVVDKSKMKNIALDSLQNTTDIHIPITNAPIVEHQNSAKDEIYKKFVLVPVLPEGNDNGMFQFQEGKPITFYPVSVDKIKEYARDRSDKDDGKNKDNGPSAANPRNVYVQEVNGKPNVDNVSSASSVTRVEPIIL